MKAGEVTFISPGVVGGERRVEEGGETRCDEGDSSPEGVVTGLLACSIENARLCIKERCKR